MEVVSGTSFSVTSAYIASRRKFDDSIEILVYVEGFEDVAFWKKIFASRGIPVTVKAFGLKNKANGKGTILSAINEKRLILGKNLIVAIDSDYDYLLDKNTEHFGSEFVFQTYAYSIENLAWNPSQIDSLCQTCSNETQYLKDNKLKEGLLEWSNNVYPSFLNFLKNGAKDAELVDNILSNLETRENAFVYVENHPVTDFDDAGFSELMENKGLTKDSVHLFIRGHNWAGKLNSCCQDINNWVFLQVRDSILAQDTDGQMVRELKNSQTEPSVVIKGMNIDCDICLPKIKIDIDNFIKAYNS
ncbi:DUF4435 domain-containing protein [Vibrio fluvialis]